MAEGSTGCMGLLFIGVAIYLALKLLIWGIKLLLASLTGGAAIALMVTIPALVTWATIHCFKQFKRRQWGWARSLSIPLFTLLTGSALGVGLTLGFASGLAIGAIAATGLPLAGLLLYPSWQRRRQIRRYREQEGHLLDS